MSFAIRKISKDDSLGTLLHTMRRNLNISLSDMEGRTKIQQKFLIAFENNDYTNLPESLYAKNYLKRYVQALGGDVSYFLARFEAECGTCSIIEPYQRPRTKTRAMQFFASHKVLRIGTITSLILLMMFYIGFQFSSMIKPPTIIVHGPNDGYTTNEALITIFGKTEPEVELLVNGTPVLLAEDGQFQTSVDLERGLNVIIIEGSRRHSKTATVYRKIVLERATRQSKSLQVSYQVIHK